jgi:peroxiredoxin
VKLKSIITLLLSILIFTSLGQDSKKVSETDGIGIGDTISNFSATDQHGELFNLETELEKGPVVVIFYRGQWCPYCNKHLSQIQDSLELIESKGAQIISISPENQEHLLESVEKTGAEFRLLYDDGYVISELFDVLFDPRSSEVKKYNVF